MLKLTNRPLGSIVPAFILFFFFSLTNCTKDPEPEPINEQEVITHVELTVIDQSQNRQLTIYDAEAESVNKTINLTSGLNYSASLQIWNRSNPADPEDVTIEIKEEVDEHLVFYEKVGEIEVDITSADSDPKDSNGVPLNLNTTWKAGSGTGKLRITLIHGPANKSATTRSSIGGETDFQMDFPVNISVAN